MNLFKFIKQRLKTVPNPATMEEDSMLESPNNIKKKPEVINYKIKYFLIKDNRFH